MIFWSNLKPCPVICAHRPCRRMASIPTRVLFFFSFAAFSSARWKAHQFCVLPHSDYLGRNLVSYGSLLLVFVPRVHLHFMCLHLMCVCASRAIDARGGYYSRGGWGSGNIISTRIKKQNFMGETKKKRHICIHYLFLSVAAPHLQSNHSRVTPKLVQEPFHGLKMYDSHEHRGFLFILSIVLFFLFPSVLFCACHVTRSPLKRRDE